MIISVLGMAVGAQPAAAATLAGEVLDARVAAVTGSSNCDFSTGPQTFNYSVPEGTASGPHPGTFAEGGSFTLASPTGPVTNFTADFRINSGPDTIIGSKSPGPAGLTGSCSNISQPFPGIRLSGEVSYNVVSPFSENGTSPLTFNTLEPLTGGLHEGPFVPTAAPGPTGPSSKDDCQNGGWQKFGFKNQGQCIKSTKGK